MNRVSSIFSQMLKLVPAPLFQRAVDSHRGERHARGFRSWDQFVAMLFCQLGQAKSLREIEEGLLAAEGKLRHLGMSQAPAHSTLAYANQQGALAGGIVLQGSKAEPAHQELRGHFGQRTEDANLDSTDRAVARTLPAIEEQS